MGHMIHFPRGKKMQCGRAKGVHATRRVADVACYIWIPSAFAFSCLWRYFSARLLQVLVESLGIWVPGSTRRALAGLLWKHNRYLAVIMEVCWSSFHGETFRFPLFFMVRPSDFHSFVASSRQTVVFTAEHPVVKPPAHTLRWHFLQDNIRRLWDHLDSLGSSQKAALIRI